MSHHNFNLNPPNLPAPGSVVNMRQAKALDEMGRLRDKQGMLLYKPPKEYLQGVAYGNTLGKLTDFAGKNLQRLNYAAEITGAQARSILPRWESGSGKYGGGLKWDKTKWNSEFNAAVDKAYRERVPEGYNPVEYARAIQDVQQYPQFYVTASEVAFDPLLMTPSRIRTGGKLVNETNKVVSNLNIPTIIGGFDWMKPVSDSVQGIDDASRIMNEAIEKAKEDTKLYQHNKELEEAIEARKIAGGETVVGTEGIPAQSPTDAITGQTSIEYTREGIPYDPKAKAQQAKTKTIDQGGVIDPSDPSVGGAYGIQTTQPPKPFINTTTSKNPGVRTFLDRIETLKPITVEKQYDWAKREQLLEKEIQEEFRQLIDTMGQDDAAAVYKQVKAKRTAEALEEFNSQTANLKKITTEDRIKDATSAQSAIMEGIEVLPSSELNVTVNDYQDILQHVTDYSNYQFNAMKSKDASVRATMPGWSRKDVNSISGKSAEELILDNTNTVKRLMMGDTTLKEREWKVIQDMFGEAQTKGIKEMIADKSWNTFIDVIGIPRTIVASYDLSAPLRQGRRLGRTYPQEWADSFTTMHKIMFDEVGARAVDESILQHPFYAFAEKAGLFFSDRGAVVGASAREEAFVSNLAREIPIFGKGVEVSERAYTTFLNKFRHDIFFNTVDRLLTQGSVPSAETLEQIARFINYGTGRGPSPFGKGAIGTGIGDVLNSVLFAPRYLSSGPAFIGTGLKTIGMDLGALGAGQRDRQVGKMYANALVDYTQTSTQWLRFMEMSGADVELDPRSSNFGKGQFDEFKFDFFAGDLQIARAITQLIMGERKSLATGDIQEKDRLEIISQFIKSKLSPFGAFTRDAWTGEDFLGEEVDLNTTKGWRQQAADRLTPMVLDQILEVGGIFVDEETGTFRPLDAISDPRAVSGIISNTYGMGFQAYKTEIDIKNELAFKHYGVMYDEIPQLDVEKRNNIDEHPTLRKFRQERKEKKAKDSRPKRLQQQMTIYGNRIDEIESEYINLVNQAASPAEAHSFIRAYHTAKYNAWEDIIDPDIEEYLRMNKSRSNRTTALDMYRQAYWSIVAPPIYVGPVEIGDELGEARSRTTAKDYLVKEQRRKALLQEAVEIGLLTRDNKGNVRQDTEEYRFIVDRIPFSSEFETDENRKGFGLQLEKYYSDEEFLVESYYWAEKEYLNNLKREDRNQYEMYVTRNISPILTYIDGYIPGGEAIVDKYTDLTTQINNTKRHLRNAGWDDEYPAASNAMKENALRITNILIDRGELSFKPRTPSKHGLGDNMKGTISDALYEKIMQERGPEIQRILELATQDLHNGIRYINK